MAKPTDRDIKDRVVSYAAEVDPVELACIIMEQCLRMKRPPGMSALDTMMKLPKETRIQFLSAANASLEYIGSVIKNAQRTN